MAADRFELYPEWDEKRDPKKFLEHQLRRGYSVRALFPDRLIDRSAKPCNRC
jgi:hypothetical protein